MSKFYSYLTGQSLEDEFAECRNREKAFLEIKYGRRIRDKHLKRFQKKYEADCMEEKQREKQITEQMAKLFGKLKAAIQLQQEFISGKLDYIPKWASTFFTKETLLNFMKSLPKEVDIPEFESAELVINFMFYCVSFGLSWSHYFLMYKDGRDTLKNVFFRHDYGSILALAKVIYIIGVTKAYDEILFRRDFYAAFPDIENYLLGPASPNLVDKVYHAVALFIVGQLSFAALKLTLDSAVNQIQRVSGYIKV